MPYDRAQKRYQSSNEDQLKDILLKSLQADFDIDREVTGFHLLERRKVRIDFLLYPKQHLVENGFDPLWFGCEVKSPAVKKEAIKNIKTFAKQCIDYTESDFDGIIPNFCLMFPSMFHFFYAHNNINDKTRHFLSHFQPFLQLLMVGTLHIHSIGNWDIRFGSQRYFSTIKGRGNVKNLGTKRNIGSV